MNLKELLNLDKKKIILKNVNGDSLGVLQARDIIFSPRFNGVSELTFTIDKNTCPYYDLITSYRRIEIQGLMKFIISNPQIYNDGINEYKTVLCKSYEVDINRKTIPLLQGTYKFYSINPSDETIMSIIMSYLPNWSVKEIDSSLWNIYRTFDLTNKPLLDFCLNECQTAYEAIFDFDTINQTISVIGFENVPKKTDIYLSHNNLINELNLTEKTENLYTALQVFGSGDLSINLVNPLGNVIFNFNHFLNQDGFMSNELKSAILEWQDLIETKQPIYANHLVNRKTKLSELITLQTQLTELESELKALEVTRDALLDSGLSAVSKNTEVKNKRIEIANKKAQIINKQNEINIVDNNLQSIQNTIGFDKYFTTEQLLQLEPFKIQTSITDENFVITEQDSEIDKQEMAQALYDKYKKILDDSSNLKFEFSTNLIDFVSLKEYQNFTNQLQWGSQVTLKVNDKGDLAYPMLLGLDIDWNDEINIQYLFSTEVKLSDRIIEYDDFSNEISNISNKMAGDSVKWGEFTRTSKDRLYDIFENGLRADLTQIVNADNQELVINEQGLLARREVSAGIFEDEQVKLIHNKLAFTRDNWNTLATVLGKVTLPDNSTAFGLNAEVILGKLIAGNQLVITNSSGTFQVDANGVLIKDLNLIIKHEDGSSNSFADEIQNVKNETSTNLSNAIETINGNISDMQEAIEDGMIVTYYQVEEPIGKSGDLWFNTTTKKLKRYNGTTWELIEDKDITTAIEKAQNAQDTADSKIITYYAEEAPTSGKSGDLWFDTNDNNKLYRHDGTTWISVRDKGIDNALTDIGNLTTKIGNAFKSNGVLDASKIDGVIDATHAYMSAVNNQVLFDSTGFWSMNNADKTKATEAVWLNERGILLGVRTTTGVWLPSNFSTAITAHGINADYITSGQLNAINIIGSTIKGGSIFIGGSQTESDCVFGVSSAGKILGLETANGLFSVDENGNVVINGGLVLGGSITWNVHDPLIEDAYNLADSASDEANSASLYITKLANGTYSGGTFINGKTIASPRIEGGRILGGEFCDLYNKGKLVLNPNNSTSNNADLYLYSGTNIAFKIYDDITGSISLSSYGNNFLITGTNGTTAKGNWNFTGNVTGIVAKFA